MKIEIIRETLKNKSLKKEFADHIINNSNNDETWKMQLKTLYNF